MGEFTPCVLHSSNTAHKTAQCFTKLIAGRLRYLMRSNDYEVAPPERNAKSAMLGNSRFSVWSAMGACMHLLPVILYLCYAYTLLCVGVYALADNYAVSKHACGKAYHLWKFCCINLVLWLFSTLTYCLWKGGGETTRARAMLLTVCYFGMFMWGMLLWQRMSPACSIVFNKHFHAIFAFHHLSTCANGVVFFLFFIHESFLGEKLGVDLTIMAELTWSRQTQYDWRLAPQYSSSYEGDLGSPLASAQYLKSEASSATTLTKSQSPPLAAASSHSIESYQAERPPGLPPPLTYGYGQPHPSFVVKQQQNFAQLPQSIP